MGIRATEHAMSLNHIYNSKKTRAHYDKATAVAESGGVKGSDYSALPEQTQESQLTKVDTSALEHANNLFNFLQNDRQQLRTIYEQFEDLTSDLNKRLINYKSTVPGDSTLQHACKYALGQIEQLLNTRSNQGYYLFAGVNETDPPVRAKAIENIQRPVGNLDPQSYSTFITSPDFKTMKIQDCVLTREGKYDNPEIVQMIEAFAIVAHTPPGEPGSENYAFLEKAQALAQTSLEGMADKLGHIVTNEGVIERQIERNEKKIVDNLVTIARCDTIDPFEALDNVSRLSDIMMLQLITSGKITDIQNYLIQHA